MLIAIGDVHAEITKLNVLIAALEERGLLQHKLIFLGDYIDRGEDSKSTLDYLITLQRKYPHFEFLMGNHEQMLLEAWEHEQDTSPFSCQLTMEVSAHYLSEFRDKNGRLRISQRQVEFLRRLRSSYIDGDVLFTHGGIDKRGLCDLWADGIYGPLPRGIKRVVRGHVVHPEVTFYSNSVAIDTGAYRAGGSLSALIVEVPHVISISEGPAPSVQKRIKMYRYPRFQLDGYLEVEEVRSRYQSRGRPLRDHHLIQFLNWKDTCASYVLEEKITIPAIPRKKDRRDLA